MTAWSDTARRVIAEVHAAMPADVSFADRKAAIDAAYPFGERAHWPYKVWLRERRAYLRRFDPRPPPGGLFGREAS